MEGEGVTLEQQKELGKMIYKYIDNDFENEGEPEEDEEEWQ